MALNAREYFMLKGTKNEMLDLDVLFLVAM